MRKVNKDEDCETYKNKDTFRDNLPWDEKRVTYISSRWDVTRNCARTLILKELGKSNKEISNMLYVSKGTVSKYVKELCDKIHVDCVMGIKYKRFKGIKFDVWGRGKAEPIKVTKCKEEVDPEFLPQEKPVNRGTDITDIPKELISLNIDV